MKKYSKLEYMHANMQMALGHHMFWWMFILFCLSCLHTVFAVKTHQAVCFTRCDPTRLINSWHSYINTYLRCMTSSRTETHLLACMARQTYFRVTS
jgi:hypothetical protein